MPDPRCANCGIADHTVALASPDMDIKPVPLCAPCWFHTLWGAGPVQGRDYELPGGRDDG